MHAERFDQVAAPGGQVDDRSVDRTNGVSAGGVQVFDDRVELAL